MSGVEIVTAQRYPNKRTLMPGFFLLISQDPPPVFNAITADCFAITTCDPGIPDQWLPRHLISHTLQRPGY